MRIRHPALYLLVALTLGPVFAWAVVRAAWFLPWTRDLAIDMFTRDPWRHAVPFALACASLAWAFRRRIATATGRRALMVALWCSLLGGPAYLTIEAIWSLITVPGQLSGGAAEVLAVLLLGPLASVFMGGAFGALFLPVTLPLTWCAIVVLRVVSGGTGRQRAAHGWA